MSMPHPSRLRQALERELSAIDKPFVIATSGGIDSASLVAAARSIKATFAIVSFTLADRESKDFVAARRIAATWGYPFLDVRLPIEPNRICQDVVTIIRKWGAHKKTSIECIWPFLYVFDVMQRNNYTVLVGGHVASGHFALSKRAMIHFREPKEKFQQFRRMYFSKPDPAQIQSLARIGGERGIRTVMPYAARDIFEMFSDASHDEMNKPREKEPIRAAFPELDPFHVARKQNFQLGDAGIAALLGDVVRRRFTPNAKSVISAYNYIANYKR